MEMKDADDRPYACPYRVDAPLTIQQSGEIRHYTISQTFRGGEDFEYSNSCTVGLIQRVYVEGGPSEQILKIIDARFADSLRTSFECGRWSAGCDDACSLISVEQKEVFLGWLREPISPEERENAWVKKYQGYTVLPARPSHFDLYRCALENPEMVPDLLHDGLLPHLPTKGWREIFLQYHCTLQLATEDHIAAISFEQFPTRMPKSHGIWRVFPGWLSQAETIEASQISSVCGLLVEKAVGTPMITLTDQSINNEDLMVLAQDMTLFQLQVLRCGLQIIDPNIHNFLLQVDSQGKSAIGMVDFGALSLINPDPYDPPYVTLASVQGAGSVQVSSENYRSTFDIDAERDCMFNLVTQLGANDAELRASTIPLFTELTDPNIDDYLDQYLWQTILIQFLRCQSVTGFLHQSSLPLITRYEQVKRIMHYELQAPKTQPNHDSQHWSLRSVRKIASLFAFDVRKAGIQITRMRKQFAITDSAGQWSQQCSTIKFFPTDHNLLSAYSKALLFQPPATRYGSKYPNWSPITNRLARFNNDNDSDDDGVDGALLSMGVWHDLIETSQYEENGMEWGTSVTSIQQT